MKAHSHNCKHLYSNTPKYILFFLHLLIPFNNQNLLNTKIWLLFYYSFEKIKHYIQTLLILYVCYLITWSDLFLIHVFFWLSLQISDKLTCQGIREEDIGVITPYNSQVNLIQQYISNSVEIHTIDKYQVILYKRLTFVN